MKESGNWSNDSQAHTQMCILESQLEVKANRVSALETENLFLKEEVKRLQNLIKNITKRED